MANLDKITNNLVRYSLNTPDLLAITDNKYKIILYEDIPKFKTLTKLLGPNNGIIILYQTTSRYKGHWVCIWADEDKISYFDSYGFKPDEEAEFAYYVSQNLEPYLTQILHADGRQITYNHYKLQKFTQDVNTCGRWVAIRLRWKKLSHKKFHDLFEDNKLNADMLITYLTFMFINEDEADLL